MEFRTIEHTADIGVEVTADSLGELFRGAALAMVSLIVDLGKIEGKIEREISLKADDLDELMFMWLNEILYLLSAKGLIFKEFDVSISDCCISSKMIGEKFTPERHKVKEEIKAATYHELGVERRNEGWMVRVIFDV
ncbi:MAG: archease [Actinomycetota bacterium]|nr:archease [Actinomycetota bacterium]